MRRLSPLPNWSHEIAFERVAPELNRYRSYRLLLTQDLFGHWVLIRSWGRIGKPQRSKQDVFLFRFDARQHAHRIVRRRLCHGYQVARLDGTNATIEPTIQ